MKLPPRATVILMVVAVVIMALGVVVANYQLPRYFAWQQQRMVARVLAADPEALREAGRQLLQSRPGYVGKISATSSDIPLVIRRLKPTGITFNKNSLRVDFGDVYKPFGLLVYPVGAEGVAPHKWIDGLWLYDDGQLDGQLDGQPVGSRR